jgi:hypothetical protein
VTMETPGNAQRGPTMNFSRSIPLNLQICDGVLVEGVLVEGVLEGVRPAKNYCEM